MNELVNYVSRAAVEMVFRVESLEFMDQIRKSP